MADDLTVNRESDMLVIRIRIGKGDAECEREDARRRLDRGNQRTGVQIDGKDLYLGVSAHVYGEPKGTK